jgi:hypothetical protein
MIVTFVRSCDGFMLELLFNLYNYYSSSNCDKNKATYLNEVFAGFY